ncbi:propionyl-CoA synthetase [Paraferrimonas sedimenticola]|uniref:Propionyl-CoA synthetase PrpE n=1 Tax=Paraferrimonas sedimenticola TaxID=375674 RepID=A0AA37VSL3_9GAMM|nr:propionyl-CoA synthetase [Paraferrimonas sedimenticola]GLP94736.1 propionyl-CoA synthetase PrpE [Paraferrimonas sedimenticola]
MTQLRKVMAEQAASNPQQFWGEAAKAVDWASPYQEVLTQGEQAHDYQWFSGGKLNTCYNAVDRHVELGRGEQAAIYYDSPVTDSRETISYNQLHREVKRLAGALQDLGVTQGDTVVIYMPMIPQTTYAMLACARIGAIHSVVFGGFAAKELATRIDDAKPKIVISASCGVEGAKVLPYKPLLDEALNLSAHSVDACLIYQREQCQAQLQAPRDHDWLDCCERASDADWVALDATHPLYILYTSGTTGTPKGVVRDNGGHAVALTWSMKHIYDVGAGEVFWAASDVGWVVGHSYIVYGPLLVGATTVVYEGKPVGTPNAGAFWRVIQDYSVKSFFTAPTAIRAIKREDPNGDWLSQYDTSSLAVLFLAGERCDPDTLHWAGERLQKPVVDHWWQTETGWSICANMMGSDPMPVKAGSPCLAIPGYQVSVVDESGEPVEPNAQGAVVIKLPLPPGTLTGLWGNPERFYQGYMARYPGYYLSGDAGYMDEDGYLYIMSRLDDIINVAGHRLSTGRFEEVLCSHPAVAEAAVIGVHDNLKGQLPLGLVVLKQGVELSEDALQQELISLVREQVGAVASFKLVSSIPRLPKTRSGKILRATMRKIADNQSYQTPATIEDPSTLQLVEQTLHQMGVKD